MSEVVKLCNYCKQNRKDDDIWASGYLNWIADDDYICPLCDHKLLDTILTIEESRILMDISRSAAFFDAMIELKEKDIIEYNLKMSQFRTQVEQQKRSESKVDNTPKCPTCGSTNIEKISVGKKAIGGAMFGLFSSNIRNNMHCKNCGAKW